MKKFFINAALFFTPILIFLVGYEVVLRNSNLPNIYSYKNMLLNDKFDGVVLGNSHALRGMIAENFESEVISLANVSQSLDIDLLWLKEALKANKLKFIIINVSIPTMRGDLSLSKEKWRIKNYNIYTRLYLSNKPINNLELLNGTQEENLSNAYNYLINNRDIKADYLKKGSFPISGSCDDFYADAIKTSKRHAKGKPISLKNKKILDEVISLSLLYDFDVFIVTPPAHKTYRSLIPESFSNRLFSYLNHIESNHKNVYWLNYYKDDRFIDDYFKDSDHLNILGAKIGRAS